MSGALRIDTGPSRVEGQRVVSIEWFKLESRHLTSALVEAEYENGNVGVICRWPRNGKDEL